MSIIKAAYIAVLLDERRTITINKKAALAAATIILTFSLSSGNILNAEKSPAAQITEEEEERPVTLYFSYVSASETEDINTTEDEEAATPVFSEERPEASIKLTETRPAETSLKLKDNEQADANILGQVSISQTGTEQTEEISEQQEENTTVQQEKRYSEAEKRMIARVVYAEARGECFDGQVAVAQVVINRYESGKFGASVKRIVYGKYQFAVSKRYSKACMKAVEYAINNMPYPKNMYFFQVSKRKHWRNFVYYNRIGNHSFYCGKKRPL